METIGQWPQKRIQTMTWTTTELIVLFQQEISAELSIPQNDVDEHESFLSLGLDSVTAIFVLERMEKHLSITLNPIWFWDYPTIESFSVFLADKLTSRN